MDLVWRRALVATDPQGHELLLAIKYILGWPV